MVVGFVVGLFLIVGFGDFGVCVVWFGLILCCVGVGVVVILGFC